MMSKQIVSGRIDKLFCKDLGQPDQYGNQYAVSLNIEGQWYGLGRKKKPVASVKVGQNWHQLQEGDVIEAVAEARESGGRTYMNMKSGDITLKQAGSGGSAAPSKGTFVPNKGGSFNDDRQFQIMRQSAMGYAAQIVAATLSSKSDIDAAATEVIRIANSYFVPFAEKGVPNEKEAVVTKADTEEKEFKEDDDIPF